MEIEEEIAFFLLLSSFLPPCRSFLFIFHPLNRVDISLYYFVLKCKMEIEQKSSSVLFVPFFFSSFFALTSFIFCFIEMDPFFSFLLTLEFKIFDPFVASPFHLFHFNIPLNSIWILFKYIWRIIVFLFQQLFSSHSQSSTDITKLLPSFLLRSYPPHFSSLLRGQLRF